MTPSSFRADSAAPLVDRAGTAAAEPAQPPLPSPLPGTLPLPPAPAGAPPPPQTDTNTTKHIYVDAQAGLPRSVSMLHVALGALPPGATITHLVVKLKDDPGGPGDPENVSADGAGVVACPLTVEFTDGQPPTYDCSKPSPPVAGTRDAATGTWSFDLTLLLAVPGTASHGVALVPDPTNQSAFSVAFLRDSIAAAATFTPRADVAAPPAAAPAPDTTTTPVLGSDVFVALPSIPQTPAAATPTPPPAPATVPAAPVAAAPASLGASEPITDFRRLPRWTLLLLPVLLGAVAALVDPRRLIRAMARAVVAASEGMPRG